jgi:hypothetical protein
VDSCYFEENSPQDIYNMTDPSSGEDKGSSDDQGNAVKAAGKTTKTIGLQKTGLPFNYLILAILMVIGGLVPRRR